MAEAFDSWKGFLDAGFVEDADGRLRMGTESCFCTVAHADDELRVHFETDVVEFPPATFVMPCWMKDVWDWSARFAQEAVGTRADWERLRREADFEFPHDLAELLEIGFDDLEGRTESDETVDDVPAGGSVDDEADPGSTIPAECLKIRDRLDRVREIVWNELQQASQACDLENVKSCLARLERVDGFVVNLGEIEAFLLTECRDAEGGGLPDGDVVETPVDDPDPSGPDMIEPNDPLDVEQPCVDAKPIPDESEGEGTNEVEPEPHKGHCTNFAVTFPDGVRICEAKASLTFAKALDKIGAEQVEKLGMTIAGDPIVTRDQSAIRKLPQMVQRISDGWIVKTHSSTYTKMSFLRRISAALKIDLKFELFRREALPKAKRPGTMKSRQKPEREAPPFRLEADSIVPSLFDNLDLFAPAGEDPPVESKPAVESKPVVAHDIKGKLRKLARERYYTPSILAQGLGFEWRDVKAWFKGRGLIPRDQLESLCRFMGIHPIDLGVETGRSC